MKRKGIDDALDSVVQRLTRPGYRKQYTDETEFERDVWPRVAALGEELGFDCLTSHKIHSDRSVEKWKQFCQERRGPDVNVLGTRNRLDVVLTNERVGSIGIEIKCLGVTGHAARLTQGLGQALLGLAHRDRAVLLIHCGAVTAHQRLELREVAREICSGSRVRLIVVP